MVIYYFGFMTWHFLLLFCVFFSFSSFSQNDPVENTDSVSWFYSTGELQKVAYIKETYKRKVAAHLPVQIAFDRHGHKYSEDYHTVTGKVTFVEEEIPREDLQEPYRSWLVDKNYIRLSTLIYDTINPDCPISGSTAHARYDLENCQLIRRTSDSYYHGGFNENRVSHYPYCIEEGTFNNFILRTGTMRYYSTTNELVTTIRVRNSRRIDDGPIAFKDERLLAEILDLQPIDANFNGKIEGSEASVYNSIRVPRTISSVADLRKFKQLKFIVSEGQVFEMDNFTSDEHLLTAIQNATPDPRIDPYRQADIPIGSSIVSPEIQEYPRVEASFPGGMDSLNNWIKMHQTYPEESLKYEEQGKVMVSFVVEPDGSITNIRIEKGVSMELDRAAKELIRSMPNWTPEAPGGMKVRSRVQLPVIYKLY